MKVGRDEGRTSGRADGRKGMKEIGKREEESVGGEVCIVIM